MSTPPSSRPYAEPLPEAPEPVPEEQDERKTEEKQGVARGLDWLASTLGRILISLLVPLGTFVVLWRVFIWLRDTNAPQLLTTAVAIVWGVGGAVALFFAANFFVERLPGMWARRLTPFVFVGAAIAVLGWYLAIPTLRTFITSLQGPQSQEFVGLDNYIYAFTSRAMLESFRNNLLWLVFGTAGSVGLGLIIAALADRTAPAFEVIVKSLIFMPMAISMVGASVIWRFIYEYRPPNAVQIGLLNAIVTGLGFEPQAWLLLRPGTTSSSSRS